MSVVAVVLAAGQGTRMKSELPKVLHPVAGRPLVAWPVQAALDAGADEAIVVVGHGKEIVKPVLVDRFGDRVRFAEQLEQLGTGHAVQCAMELPNIADEVLVLYGDVPLIGADTIRALMDSHGNEPLSLLTSHLEDPTGYGRILRRDGRVVGIREHKDCSPEELEISEVNPGFYLIDAAFLRDAMTQLRTDNAQGELYLTDVVALAAQAGGVGDMHGHIHELQGINDRRQLARCEAAMRLRINETLAAQGVGIRDLMATYIDADCVVEPDCTLEPGVHLRGDTIVRSGALVDVGCVLTDVEVQNGAHLLPYTVATRSRVGPASHVGPFSHLRPQTDVGEGAKVGNFCETKKTSIGRGSKVNHLAYVGDGAIGVGVNVGAGVIFCNYDGFQKHLTTLQDGVFVGSDSQLVAPVTVGEGAYVASGTTVTKDVPAGALALSRTKQVNKEGYADRIKRRMAAKSKS